MQQSVTPAHDLSDEEREARRQEQIRRGQQLIELLNELEREDPEDQRETLEFLMRALDEDRHSSPDLALDGDVILCAQAVILAAQEGDEVVIATTNPSHLTRYTRAEEWSKIPAPTP